MTIVADDITGAAVNDNPDPTEDHTGAVAPLQYVNGHPKNVATHPVHAAFGQIQREIGQQFFERTEAIEGILLALLAKEHGFLLGTPGTGKTYLIREIMRRVRNAEYFEAILSKTRPTEAILGPYDIPGLRDHGHFKRKSKGYLPTARLAMLDEVGKMPPTLGHDLLSIVLDRLIHEVDASGSSFRPVPLHTFIGGSNELPTDESPDAAAMWDRILVRIPVDEIKEKSNFIKLLQSKALPVANPTTVDYFELLDASDKVIPNIEVPDSVYDVVLTLREALKDHGIDTSARRWVQAMKLPRAAAFMRGADEVEVIDLGVLRFALWERPEDLNKVKKQVMSLTDPLAEEALQFQELVQELYTTIADAKAMSLENRGKEVLNINRRIGDLRTKVNQAKNKAHQAGNPTKRLDEVLTEIVGVQGAVLKDLLEMDPNS